MSKEEIQSAAPMKLLAHVFGKKPGQSLQDFAAEIKDVKNDAAFITEVREYALAQL